MLLRDNLRLWLVVRKDLRQFENALRIDPGGRHVLLRRLNLRVPVRRHSQHPLAHLIRIGVAPFLLEIPPHEPQLFNGHVRSTVLDELVRDHQPHLGIRRQVGELDQRREGLIELVRPLHSLGVLEEMLARVR